MRAIARCGLFVLSMVLIIGLIIPAGAWAEKAIKIGVIYPLTGGAAAAGRQLRAGVELAVEIANNAMPDIEMTMAKAAGITSMGGAKIELIFKDHEGNPTLGCGPGQEIDIRRQGRWSTGLLSQLCDQNRQCGLRRNGHSHDQRFLHATSPALTTRDSSGSGGQRLMTSPLPRIFLSF